MAMQTTLDTDMTRSHYPFLSITITLLTLFCTSPLYPSLLYPIHLTVLYHYPILLLLYLAPVTLIFAFTVSAEECLRQCKLAAAIYKTRSDMTLHATANSK